MAHPYVDPRIRPAYTVPPPSASTSAPYGYNSYGAPFASQAEADAYKAALAARNANLQQAATLNAGNPSSSGYTPTWQEMAALQDAYSGGGQGYMDPSYQNLLAKFGGNQDELNQWINKYSYNPGSFTGFTAANPNWQYSYGGSWSALQGANGQGNNPPPQQGGNGGPLSGIWQSNTQHPQGWTPPNINAGGSFNVGGTGPVTNLQNTKVGNQPTINGAVNAGSNNNVINNAWQYNPNKPLNNMQQPKPMTPAFQPNKAVSGFATPGWTPVNTVYNPLPGQGR